MGAATRRWRRMAGAAGATLAAGMVVGGLVGATQAGATSSTSGRSVGLAASVSSGGGHRGAAGAAAGHHRAASGLVGGDGGTGAIRCTQALFSSAQKQVEHGLAARAQRLSRLSTLVQKATARGLSSSDAAALSAILAGERSTIDGGGITGLQQAVPAETTCAQLAVSARQMVVDFRVFALVTPQVRLTVGHDVASAVVARGTAAEPRISARIAAAARHGKDVAGAENAFAGFEVRMSAAGQALSGVSTTQLLAQTPANYPGDKPMLQAGRATAKKVVTDLKAARRDLRTIRHDLAGPGPRHGSPAGSSSGSSTSGGSSSGSTATGTVGA